MASAVNSTAIGVTVDVLLDPALSDPNATSPAESILKTLPTLPTP